MSNQIIDEVADELFVAATSVGREMCVSRSIDMQTAHFRMINGLIIARKFLQALKDFRDINPQQVYNPEVSILVVERDLSHLATIQDSDCILTLAIALKIVGFARSISVQRDNLSPAILCAGISNIVDQICDHFIEHDPSFGEDLKAFIEACKNFEEGATGEG